MAEQPFWKVKTLEEMTPEEWESLCDGCCRCCLYKLQDEESGELYYTNVVCSLLEPKALRCTVYEQRRAWMPTCLKLDPALVRTLTWLPRTCAYRLVLEGKDLRPWHPLVSGDPKSVERARISIRGRFIREQDADMNNLEDYVVRYFD